MQASSPSRPIVSLSGVAKRYAKVTALERIDFELFPGEVMGLFGHNGAGKTTIMKLILGIIPASDGQVKVFGQDPLSKQAFEARKQVGYLPENVSFYDQLTGREVLRYFARLKSVPKQAIEQLLEQVGLTHAMDRQVKTYSKGMRQRLGLAQAFVGSPKLLLLDEPTVGLDPIATQEFYASVDKLKSEGASIILCSHVLPGVEQHIDRALIISGGRLLAKGSLSELRQQAQLPVAIKTQGLNGALKQDARFTPYLIAPDQLLVPEQEKLAIIRQLVELDQLGDIRVEPADLERVYQHYLGQRPGKAHKGDNEIEISHQGGQIQ
ncbi:ABC transporter ATP-binding protein [Shewanella spartinae]|uniref:ABC transporter ATP-binding protein n=1 Tax=Shewanella spartinae TaxID=2864205 RepID=UPI001C65D93B|nr:ABC transporter ATP-binding protein [Shewanella spartinae]QYJ93379.1 ABC transporter ATP-binding protein [Shewanella spartinae]